MSGAGIDNTFGASLIGVLITAMLYGVTNLQTYFYYSYYPKDRIEHKVLVGVIWALDTAHMGLAIQCIYYYLITNFDNPPALVNGHWSLFVSVAVNIMTAFLVHVFFTLQIFSLCKPSIRWYLSGFIGLLVVAHMCFGLVTVVFFFIKKEFTKLSEITLFAAMPFALFAVLSDIAIAASLVALLWGNRTGFRRTVTLVNTLIVYAINRCILTSIFAATEIIAFASSPHSLWFLSIEFFIGKLYANSLLATLNSRNKLRSGDIHTSFHMSDFHIDEDVMDTQGTARKGVAINFSPEEDKLSNTLHTVHKV